MLDTGFLAPFVLMPLEIMGYDYPRNGPIRVLVVDDQPLLLSLYTQILRREGYTLATATDGAEALRISRTYPAQIDLLLSDVEMPGMSGIELAKQILAERPEIRVILTSGTPLPSGTVPPFLFKPFTTDELLEKIRTVLGRQPQALDNLRSFPRKEQKVASACAWLSMAAMAGIATWLLFKKSNKAGKLKMQRIALDRVETA